MNDSDFAFQPLISYLKSLVPATISASIKHIYTSLSIIFLEMKSVTYVIESVRLMAVRGLSGSDGRLGSYLSISTLPKRRLLHHLLLGALIIATTTHGISSLILWLVHRVCERVD